MTKIKNILSNILILLMTTASFLYADPPNWDENGDGVLDNYTDYEFNGSVTAAVFNSDINIGDDGDMIACFVNGEQRGVGITSLIPFGPYEGTYQFQMMIYSNQSSGENIIFQYYDASLDEVYFLNENLTFESNMVEGDVFNPLIFSYSFELTDPPNWDENSDGVLDNYTDYEFNGSVTAAVFNSDINIGDDGDMIACFVNGEQRGVGITSLIPFGPYEGTYQFQMMIYSNQSSGDDISLQFYDISANEVYYINESLTFESNMVEGDVFNPLIFTYIIGDNNDIEGCTDLSACNYNAEATLNDGSCEYPETNYNCNGECIANLDCLGICGGTTIEDICGVCDGDNSTCTGCTDDEACNYDQDAIIDIGCIYPEENFNCYGECIVAIDCFGICGGSAQLDECGVCDGDGIVDEFCDCQGSLYDCNGICGGNAYIDNCENCVSGNTELEPCTSYSYNVDLHFGSNLISFYALPDTANIESIMYDNDNDFIYSILGENLSSYNSGGNTWQGSLISFESNNGYWLRTENSTTLNIQNAWDINDDIQYNLHAGSNLISFPEHGIYDLSETLPDDLELYIDAILGESVIAVKSENNDWVGSLTAFEGGRGYWFIVNTDFTFFYNINQSFARNSKLIRDFMHTQSSIQSFYILDNSLSSTLEIGDWILAFKDDDIVGSLKFDGNELIVPVMGNDGQAYSKNYCNYGDVPNFKILRSDENRYINLYGEVDGFVNQGISYLSMAVNQDYYLDSFEINYLYPNPFNPSTIINFSVFESLPIKIDLYDINGRYLKTIVNDYYSNGNHDVLIDGANLSSGIYYVQITSTDLIKTEKITLIK